MDTKIIEKIQKLLALSTSDNVNEAASAARSAQELMTKYRIELADVEAATPGAKVQDVENVDLFREKSIIPWKSKLAVGLAKANDCAVYIERGRVTDVHKLIGTKSSIQIVSYMYAYLVREVDRLAAMNRKSGDRTWLRSFRMGAAQAIVQRLIQANESTKAGASGTSLVVLNRDLERVNAELAKLDLKKAKPQAIRDADGYHQGVKAGQNVQLSSGPGLPSGPKGHIKGE